jgi:SAM-dependent methyltransferase
MSGGKKRDGKFRRILEGVGTYYAGKLNEHGTTPRGVDLNSPEAQHVRFEQLLKVCDLSKEFSINDYGCGYGALIEYMNGMGYVFQYRGFDISEQMIAEAKRLHMEFHSCEFLADESLLTVADYTISSGIFNVKLQFGNEEWLEYILATLDKMNQVSDRGFAFNALTIYSDKEYMRDDLYYADPCHLFDYCKTNFSRNVALLHDYGLYDFTVIVRKKLG